MNLAKYKLLAEDDDTFHVEHEDGTSFKVAKKGLGKSTLEKITQHFAEGGEVDPEPTDPALLPEPTPANPPFLDTLGQAAGDTLAAVPVLGAPIVGAGAIASGAKRLFAPPEDAAEPVASDAQPQPAMALNPMPQMPAAKAPGLPSAGPYEAQLGQAMKDEEGGVKAQADITAQQAEAEAKVHEEHQRKIAGVTSEWDKRMAGWQQRGDQLAADVASFKVDPNKFWSSQNTGQKLTAAIGMIVGGLGQGMMGGGPNYAIQAIDKAIERDLESQKSELGKKENMLARHMAEGHDLQEAKRLAIADAKDAAAGALAGAALKYAGPKAQAIAQVEAAKLRASSATLRQEVAGRGLDMSIKKLSVQQAQQAALAQQALSTQAITPEMLSKLPPEHPLRKTGVFIPEETKVTNNGKPVLGADGKELAPQTKPRYYQAIDEDTAKKARPEFATNAEMASRVSALEKFAKEHPAGAWGRGEVAKAKSLANDIKLSFMKSQEGVAKLTDTELEMLDQMVADPASAVGAASGSRQASIDFLKKSVANKRNTLKAAYLLPGS